MVMQHFPSGDLSDHMRNNGAGFVFNEWQVAWILLQMLGGVRYLHHMRFAHRDLKPSNTLIESMTPQGPKVKIADLGLARRCEKPVEDALESVGVHNSELVG